MDNINDAISEDYRRLARERAARRSHETDTHVGCDEGCGALKQPMTYNELKEALEHWRYHAYLDGDCAHGC